MSLAKTRLQDIRATYPSNLDRDELRQTQTGLVQAVREMTDAPNSIVSDDLKQQAIESEGRKLDVPVYKKGSVTIKNVRSCTIAGGENETDLVTITWKTLVADVLMIPERYRNNQIKYNQDFNRKITELVEAFLVEMENDLDTAFDTNKSQVYGSSIVTGYGLTGSAIQVEPHEYEFFFNDLDAINMADDFNEPNIKVIANHTLMPHVRKYINQGGGNSTNTQFQFLGKDFLFSNRVTNGAGVNATGYFMPDGSVGLLTRTDGASQMGLKAGDGTEWFEDLLPGFPFPVGVQYKSKCDDKSALETAGNEYLEATLVEHYQFSVDFAIVVPYNTDLTTKASSIRKFEFIPDDGVAG